MWQLRWYHVVKGAALVVLAEQLLVEALIQGVNLAEAPALCIAAFGALLAPVPTVKEPS